jgi:hypothetical protein
MLGSARPSGKTSRGQPNYAVLRDVRPRHGHRKLGGGGGVAVVGNTSNERRWLRRVHLEHEKGETSGMVGEAGTHHNGEATWRWWWAAARRHSSTVMAL